MGKAGVVLNAVLVVIMINTALFAGYYWRSMKNGSDDGSLEIFHYSPLRNIEVNASSRAAQFYDGMRFNHNNLSYYADPYCSKEKVDELKKAFEIIKAETAAIDFYQEEESKADILVACHEGAYEKEENVFIAGEGGPTKIVNSSLYPVITRGKILLYNQTKCEHPVTELHEILHVLGFEHINDSSKIMFPYVSCEQMLDENMIRLLTKLYSMPALAEIYFVNASASKEGEYLNFSVEIMNVGFRDAENVSLKVYADDEEIEKFNIGGIKYGEGRIMQAGNIHLPSEDVKTVFLELATADSEMDKNNNRMEMVLREA